jgi:diamine N-acetyltransferase
MIMEAITLQPINAANWITCINLAPTEEQRQQGLVATNELSLAQAYAERWWTPYGIYADETMVGFIMVGCWPDTPINPDYGLREPGVHHILRLMIDGRYQRRGYAGRALESLITMLKAQPQARVLEVNYDADNVAAAYLYEQVGFWPTGIVDEGELRVRLWLRETPE